MKERLAHPFDPIVFPDTEILILGSFPSIDSFEKAFYYAHPRNQFWPILSEITGYPVNNRDQKIWLLKRSKLGLWDMVAGCRRENSLDSSLKGIEVNDIPGLLRRIPTIRKILFTGRKAQELFERNFGDLEIERDYLPSPSPAYAAMNFGEKVREYGEKLEITND
ncbi:DNA-deoxyinosine glycosylase [Nitratifractor sp.]|uniref:DNA-deoxyinosine glycosylase n=1 Tax=Nitratifractor sp. TaxID=2268144 RepID=UPI0025D38E8C|nr:DNA-deoxyinosine glycosylase [Nitratifractor sp.]